jgi:hypothetical protein
VLLLLCITVFLWKPISSGGYYAPGDLSQATPVLRAETGDLQPGNGLLGDVAHDIVPWHLFDKAEIRDGKLPLWNTYNGSGVPHLANAQSAVFSPYTAPFYVFGTRAALLASTAMMLMVSGLLTYGLARRLGLGHLAGMAAAIGFTFAGINIVWMLWTVTPAASFLPGIVWMTCVVVDGKRRRPLLLGIAGLAALVALSLLSGHPETTAFAIAGSLVFAGFLLWSKRSTLARAVRRLGMFAGGVALGAGLAAVQVLPLVEYVHHRAPSGQRQAFMHSDLAGLLAFPFFYGSPFGSRRDRVLAEAIPYIKSVGIYMAGALVVLALVGYLSFARRRRWPALAMGAFGVAWVAVVFDVGEIGRHVTRLPGLDLAMALRSVPLWGLAIALLGSFGIEVTRRAIDSTPTTRRRVLVRLFGSLAVFVVFAAIFAKVLGHAMPSVEGAASAEPVPHVLYVGGWFLVAIAAIVIPLLVAQRRGSEHVTRAIRVFSAGVLLLALFASSAYMWRAWNPTVPASSFYARTAALTDIQKVIGNEQAMRLDDSAIGPDLNLAYGIRSPENYDALGIAEYESLFRRLLHPPDVKFDGTDIGILAGPIFPESIGALRTLGIRYVTTAKDYPFASGSLSSAPAPAPDPNTVALRFAPAPGVPQVSQLVVHAPTVTDGTRCRLALQRAGVELVRPQERACASRGAAFALPRSIAVGDGFTATFAITDRLGRAVAPSGDTTGVALATKVPGLDLVGESHAIRIFRVPDAPPHVFSPARTVEADANADQRVVESPDARPLQLTTIDAPDAASAGAPGRVSAVRNDSGDIRFRVTRAQPGWAVVMETHYPGWKATVNGRSVAVRRANEAFMAVPVPAGAATVHLSYEPRSLRAGFVVSALSMIVLVVLLVVAFRASGRRDRSGEATAT